MTSTLRELEREVLRETSKRLVRHGFAPRPKGQTFYRPLDGGQAAVHLTFIEHEHDVDITVDVAIRFDAVEELVHRSNKLLSNKEKAETFTLGAELGNLESGAPYRVTVTGSGDVDRAVTAIIAKLEEVGLPYIEKYSRPEAAYDVLSRDDKEAWMHSPIHAERAKRACALLAALNRQSEIETLGARKLSFLESIKDAGRLAFGRLLEELKGK